MMFLFSPSLHSIQSNHIQTIQYTSTHIDFDSKHSMLLCHDFLGLRCGLCGPSTGALPGRPVAPEAATTSPGQLVLVVLARCATSCGRGPALWLQRRTTGGPCCTTRRARAAWRSARCCWRRGPRSRPGMTLASRP